MKYKSGEEFLNKLYSEMYKEYTVSRSASKNATPTDKISGYLERLEDIHNSVKDNEHKLNLLKQFYYEKYIIKELPDNYIAFRQRIARERGLGSVNLTKAEMLSDVQEKQRNSLDKWIDYLIDDKTDYPMWFKNYIFRGVLSLNRFDNDTLTFNKRTRTTTQPYIEVNADIIECIYNTLATKIGDNKLTDEQKTAINNGESFGKLYAFYLAKRINNGEKKGVWVRYKKGSNYQKLVEDLQGTLTNWCIADEMGAEEQLFMGDLYVYYTKGDNNDYSVPRVVISMEDSLISEVRGIAPNQEIEQDMIPIVSNKLSEFSDKDRYLKKANDMRKMTEIDNKQRNSQKLTRKELKFLYEYEKPIQGFGMERDPRIDEIKSKRDSLKDYAKILVCDVDKIAFISSLEELENCSSENIIYTGDLKLEEDDYHKLKNKEAIKNIVIVTGDARLTELASYDKLRSIGGNLHYKAEYVSENLKELRYIVNNAYLENLKSSRGLENLKSIGGHACLNSMQDATGFNSLQSIGGNFYIKALINSNGLSSLESIGLDLHSPKLENFSGFRNLYSIGSIRQDICGVAMTPRSFMSKVKNDIRNEELSKMIGESALHHNQRNSVIK